MVSSQIRTQAWRLGAIVLFLGLPLVFAALATRNFAEASQADELTARKVTTLAAIVGEIERYRTHKAKPVDTGSLYLSSTSASLARAEIQALATRIVDEAGGRVVEIQLTETPEQDVDGMVAIEVTLGIDNKGLRDLLYKAESGLPLLTVSDLDVQRATAQGDDASTSPAQLKVQITLQGHWRRTAG